MIAIFRSEIQKIGGIESWLYYLAKKYSQDYEIVLYYGGIDQVQLHRLSKFIKCIKYSGQDVECDTAIYCYDFMGLSTTKAKKYVHIVHADYANISIPVRIPDAIDEYYAVSKIAARSFSEITGKKCGVLYNPISLDSPRKVLKLISATRLTQEKGLDRIRELARALDSRGILYQWDIFTSHPQEVDSPNVVFRKHRLDIINFIADADYLVQLSDTESYCYSLVEALSVGTKVISTNLPVLDELQIDSKHGVIIDLKDKNYDKYIDDIANYEPLKQKYTAPDDNYSSIFGKKCKSKYTYDGSMLRVIKGPVYFVEEALQLGVGDFIVAEGKRKKELLASGYVNMVI